MKYLLRGVKFKELNEEFHGISIFYEIRNVLEN